MKKVSGIQKGDWKAIALCVFAAITFWFFNAMTNDYSIDVTHPLIINYPKDEYIPLTTLPKQIRFSTTASGWDIFTKTNFINSSPIELELENFKKRRYVTSERLKTIVAKQMKGIHINEILDDTIFVNFDKLKSKKVRLQVESRKLSLAEGFRLAGDIQLTPSVVEVTGPVSMMKKVPDFFTLKIDTKDISGTFEEKLPFAPSLDKKFTYTVDKVNVKFETFQLEKIEKELKFTKLNFPKKKKIKISDDVVVLTYFARKEDLPLIEIQKFEAELNFYDLNEKDKTIKITLKKTPELILHYEFKPSTIKITYND